MRSRCISKLKMPKSKGSSIGVLIIRKNINGAESYSDKTRLAPICEKYVMTEVGFQIKTAGMTVKMQSYEKSLCICALPREIVTWSTASFYSYFEARQITKHET